MWISESGTGTVQPNTTASDLLTWVHSLSRSGVSTISPRIR
ncbi:Uncharacterised protein [Mycobacterium tuberculosis]|nr:Uncharacterised protein [Mycobacterium tuberculosis]